MATGLAVSAIAVASSDENEKAVKSKPPIKGKSSRTFTHAITQADIGIKPFDPRKFRYQDNQAIVDLEDNNQAILSLNVGLQEHLRGYLNRYSVPSGAVVALEPATGRVLTYLSHSLEGAKDRDLVLDPSPPAASVFKIVTAAALVDAGVDPETRVCYSGGFRRLKLVDLMDRPRGDRHCATFQEAMGSSINAIFAKLTDRNLSATKLRRFASAFGFGHALPFDVPTRASKMDIPEERIEFARTASGFWHNHLSPFHASLIASTIANDGIMQRATMIDRVIDKEGKALYQSQPTQFRAVIPRYTARLVGQMMTLTTTRGTARRAFYDQNGRPFLPGIQVAGKTGSLTQSKPYRAYSWWVGYAPVEQPSIAVAALVVNDPYWRIKGSHVGREALRWYLIQRKRQGD